MYSKTCKFKRSINRTVRNIVAGVSGVCLILALILGVATIAAYEINSAELLPKITTIWGLIVGYFVFLVLAAVAEEIIVPDFSYTIRVYKEDFMVFEFSESDYRTIKTSFEITSKNRKYMTLEDGYARIRIAYDKSVVEFLNGIKK